MELALKTVQRGEQNTDRLIATTEAIYQYITKDVIFLNPEPSAAGEMKHFYEKITGWFTFPRFYKDMVEKLPNGSQVIEVGTYEGCSFSFLMVEMHNAKKQFNVTAIDSFTFIDDMNGGDENIEVVFHRNMKPFAGRYNTIKGDSSGSADQFADGSLDMVFLDADHVTHRVKSDIEAWWPKIAKGGILAGHDFCPEHPGVEEAVREIFGDDFSKDYLDELVWFKIKE